MKKKFLGIIILLLAVMVMPCSVFAESATVTSTGLKEAIEEEISTFGSSSTYEEEVTTLENADLSNYSESDDKVNVYIFRGSTCSHCLDAIAYFASIVGDYGKYFNVVTYETWSNTANSSLMSSVASVMGDDASGVPYIVIGDKSYVGFTSSMADSMLSQIKTEYASDEKYDVMDHLNETSSKTTEKSTSTGVTVALVIIVLVGGIALIYLVSKSK